MITPEEIALARHAIDHSLALGAQKVRVTLNKSLMELVGTLDGQIDKVSHCLDRSLTIALFVEGRYGGRSGAGCLPGACRGYGAHAGERCLPRPAGPRPQGHRCRDGR